MIKTITKAALAASLCVLPGVAFAGNATATGSARLSVSAASCAITGAAIDLGTYKTTDTWQAVADDYGLTDSSTYTPGTKGFESLTLGFAVCSPGTLYDVTIRGTNNTSWPGIRFTRNGRWLHFYVTLKRIGNDIIVPDSRPSMPGAGYVMDNFLPAAPVGVGIGQAQALKGGVVALKGTGSSGNALMTTPLAEPGTATDSLVYSLTF